MNRVQNAISPGNDVFILYLLQVIGSSVQGMLNAAAYGLNLNVREAWVERLGGYEDYRVVGFIIRNLNHKGQALGQENSEIDEDGEELNKVDDTNAL